MARPVEHDGAVYQRKGTNFWWMRYRERDGSLRRESTSTTDWHEAQKCLRLNLETIAPIYQEAITWSLRSLNAFSATR